MTEPHVLSLPPPPSQRIISTRANQTRRSDVSETQFHSRDSLYSSANRGADYEERATEAIRTMETPVLAMIGGVYAPPGRRMGHAGAIVEGNMGTAQDKLEALIEAGAHPCKTFTDIPKTLARLGV
jgi:hypothetical protein